MKRSRLSMLVVLSALGAGCVVEERVTVKEERPPRPCEGGEWIRGHRGPHGRWHPGHWRCPGVVEVIEVD